MSSEPASAALPTGPVERRPGGRIRPKVTWNETRGSDEECAAALVEGVITARLEDLLLGADFVAELEREFGLEVDGALVVAGAAMRAVLPEVFGDPPAGDGPTSAEAARRVRLETMGFLEDVAA